MSNPSLVETPRSSDLATFTIKVDGTELSDTYHVVSIDVSKEVNRIASARIVLLDGDVAAEEFPASDADLFVAGAEIEIEAGYHREEELIFQGILLSHSVRGAAEPTRAPGARLPGRGLQDDP